MRKVKVLIVDDSAAIQGLFSSMLSSDEDIEVLGCAGDPYEAREKIKKLNPDVITLDVEMPKMDGLSFLAKIMALKPMPVIMASTLTTKGADVTLRALELGAVDYIAKPQMQEAELDIFQQSLVQKVKMASRVRTLGAHVRRTGTPVLSFNGPNQHQLIAIGSSTGGVEALRDILPRFPANSPPVVVVQHMPEVFTATMARRLNDLCPMQVQEAADGQPVLAGHIYIAPGSKHLEITQKPGQLLCRVQGGELVSGHRPSVDKLFSSVALLKHRIVVGAILTGMGHDGAKGLLEMKQAGAYTLGQAEASCVVYGMPRAAKALGAVDKEIMLPGMAWEILKLCHAKGV